MLDEKEEKALARSDIIIEGNTATWDMNLDGDIHGTYRGSFKFRCYIDPMQQMSADRERRELLGVNPFAADEHVSLLAYALPQLKYRIISAPPFWASQNPAAYQGNIADDNVIVAVLNTAIDAEIKYKAQLKKKKLDAVERAKAATEKRMTETEDEDEDDSEDKTSED